MHVFRGRAVRGLRAADAAVRPDQTADGAGGAETPLRLRETRQPGGKRRGVSSNR